MTHRLALALTLLLCAGCKKETPAPVVERSVGEDAVSDAVAVAVSDPDAVAAALTAEPTASTSIRNPNDGSLRGGIALPLRAPGLAFNPTRDPAGRYATVEVVQALLRAGEAVHAALGGLPVFVNDLSLKGGGPITRHASHQSGRDVDVLFYQLGPDGQPIAPVGAFFDRQGRGVDFKDLATADDDVALQIDLPRTWRFVQALIEDERALLQRIHVAEHLRVLLLEEAQRQGAAIGTVQRFAEMTCQPSYPHDDHFHFRFFCSAEDIRRGCRDSDPVFPWRKRQLAADGVRAKPLLRKRKAAKAEVVTHEEARAAAGPMHDEVKRWLDLREAWLKQPHPGRRYCE